MTLTFRVHPRDLGKFEKKFAGQLRLGWQRTLTSSGKKMEKILTNQSLNIRDLGSFQQGWRSKAVFTRLEVWNISNHWIYVEKGRLAGTTPPPIEAIEPWAQRKLGRPDLAFVIARKIGQKGIKARPVLTSPATEDQLSDILVKDLSKFWDECARRSR